MKCMLFDALPESVQSRLCGYSDRRLMGTAHEVDGASVEIAEGLVKRKSIGIDTDAPEVAS
jgi:hypothetical protein